MEDVLHTRHLIERIDTSECRIAAAMLVSAGEASISLLSTALNNPSWRVAATAAYILGKIGSVDSVEPLIQTIEQKRFFVTEAAIWALGQIGDARCIDPIINLLTDWSVACDIDVVTVSAEALGHLGQEVSPFLNKVVDQGVENCAEHAALAVLSRMPDELAIPPLISLLEQMYYSPFGSDYVYGEAAAALSRIGWPAAKLVVEAYLGGGIDEGAFFNAIIYDARVVDLVFNHVQQDKSQANQDRAVNALRGILDSSPGLGRRFAERLLPIALSLHDKENRFAWEVLEIIGGPEVQLVFDRWDATDGSYQECDEAIAQAITAIATLSERV